MKRILAALAALVPAMALAQVPNPMNAPATGTTGHVYVVGAGNNPQQAADGGVSLGAMAPLNVGTGLSVGGGNLNVTGAPPTGAAGGVLAGTYPNPGFASIAAGTVLANATGSSAAPSATAPGLLGVTATGSTTSRTLATRAADYVNVLDYGASCSSGSDTTAFNAAIAASYTDGIILTPCRTANFGTLPSTTGNNLWQLDGTTNNSSFPIGFYAFGDDLVESVTGSPAALSLSRSAGSVNDYAMLRFDYAGPTTGGTAANVNTVVSANCTSRGNPNTYLWCYNLSNNVYAYGSSQPSTLAATTEKHMPPPTVTVGGTKTTGNVMTVTTNSPSNEAAGTPFNTTYTVLSGDTLTTIATGIAAALNANSAFTGLGLAAASSGAVVTIAVPDEVPVYFTATTSGGSTETLTIGPGFPANAFALGGQMVDVTGLPSVYSGTGVFSEMDFYGNDLDNYNTAGVRGILNLVYGKKSSGLPAVEIGAALSINPSNGDTSQGHVKDGIKIIGLYSNAAIDLTGAAPTGTPLGAIALPDNSKISVSTDGNAYTSWNATLGCWEVGYTAERDLCVEHNSGVAGNELVIKGGTNGNPVTIAAQPDGGDTSVGVQIIAEGNLGVEIGSPSGGVALSTNGLNVAGNIYDNGHQISDTSGNLYSATLTALKNVCSNSSKVLVSCTPAAVQAQPGNPTGTTSTTAVMMGLGVTITPATNGRLLIIISGNGTNTVVASGGHPQIYYGTGTAPVNGAAVTGTAAGSLPIFYNVSGTAPFEPFTVNAITPALTVGTTYWIDLGLFVATSGTASVSSLSVSAVEE